MPGRNWSGDHGGLLFSFLLSPACFVILPRTTCPGMALPTMGWVLPDQSSVKQMSHWRAYMPIQWRSHFLSWGSLLPDNPNLLSSWQETKQYTATPEDLGLIPSAHIKQLKVRSQNSSTTGKKKEWEGNRGWVQGGEEPGMVAQSCNPNIWEETEVQVKGKPELQGKKSVGKRQNNNQYLKENFPFLKFLLLRVEIFYLLTFWSMVVTAVSKPLPDMKHLCNSVVGILSLPWGIYQPFLVFVCHVTF